MSSVTENGDVTAGKPNEEKTYKKVNKNFNLLIVFFSPHVGNSDLLYVNIFQNLLKPRTNKICSMGFLKLLHPFCEIIKYFYPPQN